MDRVLGRTAGNAVEVRESIDHLTGAASDPRLLEVTFGLCEQLLRLKGLDGDPRAALRVGRGGRGLRPHGGGARRPDRPARAPRRPPAGGAGDDRGAGRASRRASRASTCAPSASPSSTSVAGGAARTTRSTTPSASPRSRRRASASVRRASRWRSSTPATRTAAARAAEALAAAFRVGDRVLDENPAVLEIVSMTAAIAKAELHVHLEGTATPDLVRRIAARNGLEVPEGVFATPDRFAWRDFLDFLNTYNMAASVIRTGEDYRDIAYEYLASCAHGGAIYVELTASVDHARLAGLSDAEHWEGIAAGHRRRSPRPRHRGAHPQRGRAQLRGRAGHRDRRAHRRATASLRRRLLAGRRRGRLPAGALPGGLPDRGRRGPGLHGARRRVGRRGLGARSARAAGHADRPRRARDRGPRRWSPSSPAAQITLEVCPTSNVVLGVFPTLRGASASRSCARPGSRSRSAPTTRRTSARASAANTRSPMSTSV